MWTPTSLGQGRGWHTLLPGLGGVTVGKEVDEQKEIQKGEKQEKGQQE